MTYRLILSPEAQADLQNMLDYALARSGRNTALSYVALMEVYGLTLCEFPARGSLRNDLTPGLRISGFERISTVFHIEPERVVVDRVLYGGRDIGRAFGHE